jgi:hypothetical protein
MLGAVESSSRILGISPSGRRDEVTGSRSPLSNASNTTNEALRGTTYGEALSAAQPLDLVCLKLYDIVAVTDQDARYGDSRASVGRRARNY